MSSRLASLRSKNSNGSKPLTSHANRVSNADASNRVMSVAPLSPRSAAAQNSLTVFPIGVSAPMPVTTTRCFIARNVEASRVVRDPRSVRHGVRVPDMRLSYDMPSLHIPFFQVLSRCTPDSADWRATTAGLVTIRLADRRVSGRRPSWRELRRVRRTIQDVDRESPLYTALVSLFAAVGSAWRLRHERVVAALRAYAT